MRLEQACAYGQKTVPFMDSIHFMHTVDLVQMERVNMRTGVGKPIRRTPPMLFNERSIKKTRGMGMSVIFSEPLKSYETNAYW